MEINGWRLIFMDTGRCESISWPMGDETRAQWLEGVLATGNGRTKILFAHHSRLSRGAHGDMTQGVGRIWEMLFDEHDKPRVAMTVAGHDHNVSVYGPRPKTKPEGKAVPFADGIYLVVNGAGGAGHYKPTKGTKPDLAQDLKNYCVTQIELVVEHTAKVVTLSFGNNVKSTTVPTVVPKSAFTLSV